MKHDVAEPLNVITYGYMHKFKNWKNLVATEIQTLPKHITEL